MTTRAVITYAGPSGEVATREVIAYWAASPEFWVLREVSDDGRWTSYQVPGPWILEVREGRVARARCWEPGCDEVATRMTSWEKPVCEGCASECDRPLEDDELWR